MNPTTVTQQLQKTYQAVGDGLLSEAFGLVRASVPSQQSHFLTRIDDLENVYRQLLSYFAQGVKDEKQAEMLLYLKRKLIGLAAEVHRESVVAQGTGLFYDRLRYRRSIGFESLVTLLEQAETSTVRKQFDELVRLIFDSLWTADALTDEEAAALSHAGEYIRLVAASALTMALQQQWHSKKLYFLLEELARPDITADYRARLLVGVVLTLRSYPHHTRLYYNEIALRLEAVNEHIPLEPTLEMLSIRFLFACETESITKHLQTELFSDIQKIAPDLRKFGMGDTESIQETGNPEWMEELEKSGLGDKIREFSELQLEGADVMHSSFMNLKGSSFFREMHNWFLPFDAAHSQIAPLLEENAVLKQLVEAIGPQLCNSDRYSFIVSMESLPAALRGSAMGAVGGELDALKEQIKQDVPVGETGKLDTAIKSYLQDLYRFYKVCERKNEFDDIFLSPIPPDLPVLDRYLYKRDTLLHTAEFLFRRKHYDRAAKLLADLAEGKESATDTTLHQKLGFSLQQQGLFAQALAAYSRAELIDTENEWLLKRMAHCYRQLCRPAEAAEIYERLFERNPHEATLLLQRGNALVEDSRYDEALQCFFRYEFSVDDASKARRPIAWCLFLTGQYERAGDYYRTILESDDLSTFTDRLNAGHTSLAMGQIPVAIDHYLAGLKLTPNGKDEFLAAYTADIPVLLKAGIEDAVIRLIPEVLRLHPN